MADEYDAAQDRGEVRTQADNQAYSKAEKAGPSDIGISPKAMHDARLIRDAEQADPGVVRRTLDGLLDAGQEPTRAALKREIAPASSLIIGFSGAVLLSSGASSVFLILLAA